MNEVTAFYIDLLNSSTSMQRSKYKNYNTQLKNV